VNDCALRKQRYGEVCFNVYDDVSKIESAGKPFRVVLKSDDLNNSLRSPVSIVGTSVCKEDHIVFGESIKYGPILPINIGGLTAPKSVLVGKVEGAFLFDNRDAVAFAIACEGEVSFPEIPAASETSYGKLPEGLEKTMTIAIPRISDLGFKFPGDVAKWPWSINSSPTLRASGTFRVQFKIGEYFIPPSPAHDRGHCCLKGKHSSSTWYVVVTVS
jgi:hypothetical protein